MKIEEAKKIAGWTQAETFEAIKAAKDAKTCTRCNGDGSKAAWVQIGHDNGKCFKCNGLGFTSTTINKLRKKAVDTMCNNYEVENVRVVKGRTRCPRFFVVVDLKHQGRSKQHKHEFVRDEEGANKLAACVREAGVINPIHWI